jgi:hypothetical protein
MMAKTKLKFSDIEYLKNSKTEEMTTPDTNVEINLQKKSVVHEYNLNTRKDEVEKKIENLNQKIRNLAFKEEMLNSIINRTYTELENLKENEFTRRGQKQSVLIKQLEALSILHDTVYKWETMIQNYHKILIDIENHKINSLIKIENLKKEEEKTDENLSEVLMALNTQLKNTTADLPENSLISEIKEELEKENY